jgi:hypothetical protein
MKGILEFINESSKDAWQGSGFSNHIKYSNNDYLKWKKVIKSNDSVLFGELNGYPELELIYLIKKDNKKIEHIGTYNSKKEELFTDDINLFGHENNK